MASIAQKHFKPFLSTAFLQAQPKGKLNANLARALLDEIETLVEPPSSTPQKAGAPVRAIVTLSKVTKQSSMHIASLVYSQTSSPAWLRGTQVQDTVHHLLVIAILDNLVALVVSDGPMRDVLVKGVTVAAPLGRKATSEAFVGPEAKTLWLSGVHASTSVKADSKTLSGSALEYALDPLGDQSYALSAIRSQPSVIGLGSSTRKAVIGAAPSSSRVWLGRPGDWTNFVKQVEALLYHLQKTHTPSSLYNFLSQPVTDLSAVKAAYGLAVLPSAMLEEDSGMSEDDRRHAHRWAYDASYVVTGGLSPNLEVEVILDGTSLGTVDLKVTANAEGRVSLSPSWKAAATALDELRSACIKFLADPKQVKIYYNSGHAVADCACFVVGWTDHLLAWDFHNFTGYNVGQEKPTLAAGVKLADAIDVTATGGSSLFTYVQQKLFTTGWLACDDGAMELADFVHLDPVTGRITLIHVKGAGSEKANREVSVSDYEVVVSQGVKNIRHLTPSILAASLAGGTKKDIARAVWLDGVKKADRKDMIAAVKMLPPSAPRTLIILQPRLTEAEHKFCEKAPSTSSRGLRFKQLNALMLSARIAAMGAGAEFEAIAAK